MVIGKKGEKKKPLTGRTAAKGKKAGRQPQTGGERGKFLPEGKKKTNRSTKNEESQGRERKGRA